LGKVSDKNEKKKNDEKKSKVINENRVKVYLIEQRSKSENIITTKTTFRNWNWNENSEL